MKNIISISTIAAALMFGSLALQANSTSQHATHTKLTQQVVAKEAALQQKTFKTASKDIISGLNNSLFATDAIQKKDTKAAEDALTKATKLFDKALKVDPNLKLVPINNRIGLYAIDATPKEIQKAIDMSIKLLKDHKVQESKAILQPLTDEMDIDTIYIPMDLYPTATKKALEALKKGDKKVALMTLIDGMHTFVNSRVVIPIGLLTAQDLVTAASKVEKKNKKETTALLDAAQQELQKDHLLGYIGKHSKEYTSLEKQITALKVEIKGKNDTEKLYQKVKNDFGALLRKMRLEKRKIAKNDSVWNSTTKPHAQASSEETKDKLHFEQKAQTDSF